MAIMVGISPREGDRERIEALLGPVRWLVDGDATEGVEGFLSLWPRSELRAAGKTWADFPDLQWIKLITAGANHAGWKDIPEGIRLMSTPGATADTIAEYVLGAIIAWARGFQRFTHDIRAGRFQNGSPVRALGELRIGLVGHGGIGKAVRAILTPHGSQIRAVSRSGGDGADTMEHLEAMALWADVLVLALPLRRQTHHLISDDVLDALGEGLLVNVARGYVVDEHALYRWLKQGGARHAHLDVWWEYPRGEGHPYTTSLGDLENVTMTPHNAPNVTGFRGPMIEAACHDILAIGAGEWRHIESPEDYDMVVDGDGR